MPVRACARSLSDQYDQAEKLVNEIPPDAASAAIFNVLGMVHARHGRLADAIRNFARSTEVAPDDHDAYHCLAPLLAQSGDQQAYRRLCARIVQQFAGSSDPAIAERMAKDCLILPSSGTNFESITRMVNTALAAGNNHQYWNYFQFVKGLAEYRQGHFANSAEWLQKVLADQRDPHRTMAAYMVLAMAQHQLKQTDEARATLAKGARLAEAQAASIRGPQWNDQMTARVLMAEARALIESDAK